MIYFAIKRITDNAFLPSGRKRGFTHDEPTLNSTPRLFTKERSAKDALRWWLKGKVTVKYRFYGRYLSEAEEGQFGEGDEDWNTEVVPGRDKNIMVVVKMKLEEMNED